MFGFFNNVKDLLALANSFNHLMEGIEAIESDFQKPFQKHEQVLYIELSILSIWSKENIIDVIKKNNFSLRVQRIRMPNLGGNVRLAVPYMATISRILELSTTIGRLDAVNDILEGGKTYFQMKEHLKTNSHKLSGSSLFKDYKIC
jgi:hypothetical protein